jgi:hypothetical protein
MSYIEVRVDVSEIIDEIDDSDLLKEINVRGIGGNDLERHELIKILFDNENISLFDIDKVNFLIDNISDITLEQLEKIIS